MDLQLVAPKKDTDPIEVNLSVIILGMHEIDTVNEKYTAEIYLKSRWSATKEFEIIPDLHTIAHDWKPKWKPDLQIINTITESKCEVWYKIEEKGTETNIIEMRRMKGIYIYSNYTA